MEQLDEVFNHLGGKSKNPTCLVIELTLNKPRCLSTDLDSLMDEQNEFNEGEPISRSLRKFFTNNRGVEVFDLRIEYRETEEYDLFIDELSETEINDTVNSLSKVLCDVTSIDSIICSNHSLRRLQLKDCEFKDLGLDGYGYEYDRFTKLLDINSERQHSESGENAVIRKKVFGYHFIEDFDLEPFMKMNIKLLPKVLSLIYWEDLGNNKSNIYDAIFRLVRAIPDLANVKDRE